MSLSALSSAAAAEAPISSTSRRGSLRSVTSRPDEHEGPAPDELVQRAIAGDLSAWQALQAWAFPLLERWSRSHPSMRRRGLHSLVDDVHEVATATLERLRGDDFANLRKYLALRSCDPQATMQAWLYGALDFAVREHLRVRFGRVRARSSEHPEASARAPHKRELNTLAPRLEEHVLPMNREAITARLTWRQVLSYVHKSFARREAQAIEQYIAEDASYRALADVLGLASAEEAERMIRKLKERLRTRFRALD